MKLSPIAIALVCTALIANALAQTPTFPDLTYATVGPTDLELDLYLPSTGNAPYPVLVHIHGGGWWAGSKSPVPTLCTDALAHGIAVASIDYRLTTQGSMFAPESVYFPAQIFDVKGAVRWLRANAAEYQLDPTRIAAFGSSSGGHLAALLATSGGVPQLEGNVGGNAEYSSSVQAAVDYLGHVDLLHMANDVATPPGTSIDHDGPGSHISYLVGWNLPGQGVGDIKAHLFDPTPPYPTLVQRCVQASPLTWIDSHDPPMFIAHGTADTYVPVLQSLRLSRALFAAGVQHDLRVLPNVIHNALPQPANDAALEFLCEIFFGALLPDAGTPFCSGDAGSAPCPCSNGSLPGANTGCSHSLGVGGNLHAVGVASITADTLVLRADSMLDSSALFFQGASQHGNGAGVPFGDGLRCVGAPVTRLRVKSNVLGFSQYPDPGDQPVSVRGAATAGATLYYQAWYRDSAAFCTIDTFNFTNALAITWEP